MEHHTIKKPEGGLLQSQEWMTVLRSEGKDVHDIAGAHGVLRVVKNHVPFFGSYMYAPRVHDLDSVLCMNVIAIATQSRAKWLRIDAGTEKVKDVLLSCGVHTVVSPHEMQPRHNLIMDITRPEEDLLRDMKSKTRYNIRLAQKKGVKVFTTKEKKYVDHFCDLVKRTAMRKKVAFHENAHYRKIISTLPDTCVDLYVAQYQGRIIATNIVTYYNGVATYLHGATADHDRELMAPFLLQWQIICDAKARGCEWYDLGGAFPHTNDHGKQGITRFKSGFAPGEKFYESQGSYDVVLSSASYAGYRLAQKVRAWM